MSGPPTLVGTARVGDTDAMVVAARTPDGQLALGDVAVLMPDEALERARQLP